MADPPCMVCFVKKSLIFVTQDGNEIEKLKTAYIESIFSTIEGRIKSLCLSTSSHSVANPSEDQSRTYHEQSSQGDVTNTVCNASKSEQSPGDEATCLGCKARGPDSDKCCPNCNDFLCSDCLTVVKNISNFLKKHSEQQNQVTNVKIKLQELWRVNVSIECNEHKGEVCVLICKLCKSKSICVGCINSCNHTFQNVNQFVDESKTDFNECLEKFQSSIADLNVMVGKIKNHIKKKTDIKCKKHKDKLCLFMFTHQECKTKRVCIECMDEEPNDHYFQTIIKLSGVDVKNPFKKEQCDIQKIEKRVLEEWQKFTKVLEEQAKESEQNIRKRAEHRTRLKEDLRFMVETLNSWTYVKFLPKLKEYFGKVTKELDVGNFPCEGTRCFTCNSEIHEDDKVKGLIKRVNIIEGRIGCQEILGKFTCRSKDVVYVITCERCGLQYVGETKQTLQTRMNKHRSEINKPYNNTQKYIHRHFREGACKGEDFNVAAVFEINDTEKRRHVEAALMLKLGTVNIDKDKPNKNDKKLKAMPVSPLFEGLNEKYIHQKAEEHQSMDDGLFSLDEHSYLVKD